MNVNIAGAIFSISHRRPPTRSALDNGEYHVTAFRPISEVAHSWSYTTIYLNFIEVILFRVSFFARRRQEKLNDFVIKISTVRCSCSALTIRKIRTLLH